MFSRRMVTTRIDLRPRRVNAAGWRYLRVLGVARLDIVDADGRRHLIALPRQPPPCGRLNRMPRFCPF